MDIAQSQKAPLALILGRHIVGMALFALVNPLIYHHPEPVAWWLGLWAGGVALALAFYGLYALFFTAKAKAAWPKSFIMLAWVLVALMTLEPYISMLNSKPVQQEQTKAADAEWWKKDSTPVN